MKFFIDTANLAQIKEAQALGVLMRYNKPSLMAKEGITGKNSILKHYVIFVTLLMVKCRGKCFDYDGMKKKAKN
jgi:transaldolase